MGNWFANVCTLAMSKIYNCHIYLYYFIWNKSLTLSGFYIDQFIMSGIHLMQYTFVMGCFNFTVANSCWARIMELSSLIMGNSYQFMLTLSSISFQVDVHLEVVHLTDEYWNNVVCTLSFRELVRFCWSRINLNML